MRVLEIYRITLLSNATTAGASLDSGFGDLQNYTTLKLVIQHISIDAGFGDLQNYTTLKPSSGWYNSNTGFGDLQNYTTLKLDGFIERERFSFGDLQNYTTLKLFKTQNFIGRQFWRFTELHYSQTKPYNTQNKP